MTASVTLCDECDHVEAQSRKQTPRLWLCRRHRRVVNDSFVTASSWTTGDPFLRCSAVNGGACPLFTPIRVAPEGGEHVD